MRKTIITTVAAVLLTAGLTGAALAAYNVTISNAASSRGAFSGDVPCIWEPYNNDSNLRVNDILTELASAPVVVTTGRTGTQAGNITVANAISCGVLAQTLSLIAADYIVINSAISGLNLYLVMQAGGDISVNNVISLGGSFLSIPAGGRIYINCPSITTTGNQIYGAPVRVGANTTFTTTGGAVFFASTVDSYTIPRGLTVDTIDTATFSGAVGSVDRLSYLDVSAPSGIYINGGSVVTTARRIITTRWSWALTPC